jgi:hypothetical protein
MKSIIKVYAEDCFDDNNEGYLYGLEYYDDEDEYFPIDVEWFKTKGEREKVIQEVLKEFPDAKVGDGETRIESKKEIVITVEGGIIQDINIPNDCNIRVRVMDFDVDGEDEKRLSINARGDMYNESIWENE